MVNIFYYIDVSHEAAKLISDNLKEKSCKVKELKLTKTNLTDESAMMIFKSLEVNQSVSNLNVSKNYISDKSTDAILNMIKLNKSIKTIYLSNNNLSTNAKEKIKLSTKNIKFILSDVGVKN